MFREPGGNGTLKTQALASNVTQTHGSWGDGPRAGWVLRDCSHDTRGARGDSCGAAGGGDRHSKSTYVHTGPS